MDLHLLKKKKYARLQRKLKQRLDNAMNKWKDKMNRSLSTFRVPKQLNIAQNIILLFLNLLYANNIFIIR